VGSAPKEYCLGWLDARADSGAGKLFRHGVLVKTHPRLLWEDRYLTGPPRRDLGHRGNAVIRIAWPPPWMLCSCRPSGGNDHGRFRSHFGVQVFEKLVGTAGF
jgi:hypothetical protein